MDDTWTSYHRCALRDAKVLEVSRRLPTLDYGQPRRRTTFKLINATTTGMRDRVVALPVPRSINIPE